MNNLVELNPLWFPSVHANWFDLIGSNTVIPSINITIINFTLPIDSVGVIRWFGQDVAEELWDNLTWSILINNVPNKVYGDIIGQLSSILHMTDTIIKLPEGANIKLVLSTNVNEIYAIGRLKGWYWGKDDGKHS